LNRDYRLIISLENPICLRYVARHDEALTKARLYAFVLRVLGSKRDDEELKREIVEPPVASIRLSELPKLLA